MQNIVNHAGNMQPLQALTASIVRGHEAKVAAHLAVLAPDEEH